MKRKSGSQITNHKQCFIDVTFDLCELNFISKVSIEQPIPQSTQIQHNLANYIALIIVSLALSLIMNVVKLYNLQFAKVAKKG